MTDRSPTGNRGRRGLPLLKAIHASLAVGFLLNAFVIGDDNALHMRLGMALAGLLLLWVALDAAQVVPSSFRSLKDLPQALLHQAQSLATGRTFARPGRSPFQRLMAWNLLISFAAILLTGWLLTTQMLWASSAVEELHEFSVFWVAFSTILHVAAALWARKQRADRPTPGGTA
jgi:cytochrome b